MASNPSNQFIIEPDTSSNTTGLCLNKGGDLKWRNNTVIHSGNISSQSVNYANYLAQIIAEDKLPPRFRAYGQNTSDHRNVDTTCLENGFYWVNAGTLPPNVGDADIITVNANSSYGHQLAFKFSGGGTTGSSYDGKDLYTRIYSGGSWLPWYTILTSGNYTAYAAPASHSHSYLPLSGGWMNTTAQIGCYTTSKGSSDVYNGGIQLREATGSTTSCTDNMYDAPGITFHWGGWWVHKLNMHSGTLYWDNTKVLLNGDSISWSNVSDKPNVAIRASANNLLCAGNEFNFISAGFSGGVWFNYQDENRANAANIDTYYFGNGRGGALAYIQSGYFSGTAAAANSVSWSNVTSKPSVISEQYDSTLHIRFTGGGNWNEGIRLHTNNEWNSIVMCGSDNTGDTGTSARTWSIHNYYGTFYITKNGSSSGTNYMYANDNTWVFSSAVYSNSDRHIKSHIRTIDRLSLERLFKVSDKLLKKYTLKQTGKESYGFVAQEIEKYIPEAVTKNNDDIKSVSYNIAYAKLFASLINEIKTLKTQVKTLMDDK